MSLARLHPVVLAVLCALSASAFATEAPLSADAYVSTVSPAANYGATATLNVGAGASTLLRFDLSALPDRMLPANLLKANLLLYVNRVGVPGSIDVNALGSSWSESAVTAGTVPATQRGTSATTAAVTSAGQYISVDVTDKVMAWIAAGNNSNFGFVIQAGAGDPNTTVFFDSKENTGTGHAARLDLTMVNQGQTGAQGLAGLPGLPGPSGLKGDAGAAGAIGAIGSVGSTGSIGPAGPVGLAGSIGQVGSAGATGPVGTAGVAGVAGLAGAQGLKGDTGLAGATGLSGATGATGSPGAVGLAGVNGAVGPAGSAGAAGPAGATGATGAVGTIGITGLAGVVGATGATGSSGSVGPTGISGAAGPSGSAGATGAVGPAGTTGAAGVAGLTGTQGLKGDTGLAGTAGLPGAIGATGSMGTTGAAGPVGSAGATGPAGNAGGTGATGATGNTGVAGNQGAIGPAGLQGAIGSAGANGFNGNTGPAGPQGAIGIPGNTGAIGAAGPGVTWMSVAIATQAAPNTGYMATGSSSPVAITLPVSSSSALAAGAVIQVNGVGTGGWTIVLNSGQSVITQSIPGNVISTTGSITGAQYAAIELQYIGSNTFSVLNYVGSVLPYPFGYVLQGGLIWMPVSSKQYNYANAGVLCSGTIAGQTGWRMPTQVELSALNTSGLMYDKGWTLNATWSSTPYSTGHFYVLLGNGYTNSTSDNAGLYVTCVR